MNRRGFLKGLAAALATSALVKLPAFEPGGIRPIMPEGYYVVYCSSWQYTLLQELRDYVPPPEDFLLPRPRFLTEIGEYQGLQIRETCA